MEKPCVHLAATCCGTPASSMVFHPAMGAGEEDGRRRAYLPKDSRTRYEASLEAGLDDGRDAEPYLSEAVRSRRSPPADGRQQPSPRWEPPPQKTPREDWVCGRCQALNFGRRQACFVCSSSREGAQAAGAREVRQRASSTLRVTGLSRHVDGPALQAVFQPFAEGARRWQWASPSVGSAGES